MNLPNNYVMLSTEQQMFIDTFYEKIASSVSTKQDAREAIDRIKKAINNIDFEVDFLEDEYFGE